MDSISKNNVIFFPVKRDTKASLIEIYDAIINLPDNSTEYIILLKAWKAAVQAMRTAHE